MTSTTMASSSSPRARLDNPTLYRTCSSSQSLSSEFASSTAFLSRSSSTSRVSIYGSSSTSVTKQPNGSIGGNGNSTVPNTKKTCMCSPTSHPGSFRCSLHKNSPSGDLQQQTPTSHSNNKKACMCSPTSHPGSFWCSLHKNSPRGGLQQQTPSSRSNNSSLNLIKLAMANSMIKNGIEEGNMMKRSSLSALIRRPSHHQPRRAAFQPRRSPLSVMSKAEDS